MTETKTDMPDEVQVIYDKVYPETNPRPIFMFGNKIQTIIEFQQNEGVDIDGVPITKFILSLPEIIAYKEALTPEMIDYFYNKQYRKFTVRVREDEIIRPKDPNIPIFECLRDMHGRKVDGIAEWVQERELLIKTYEARLTELKNRFEEMREHMISERGDTEEKLAELIIKKLEPLMRDNLLLAAGLKQQRDRPDARA